MPAHNDGPQSPETDAGQVLILAANSVRECGGSELFNHLAEYFPRPTLATALMSTQWTATTNFLVRIWRSRGVRYIKNRSRIVAAVYVRLIYGFLRSRLECELFRKYRDSGIVGVWCLSNELLPILANNLARRLQCPLHVSVFDLPYTFGYQEAENSVIRAGFEQWALEANSLDFASPGMAAHLEPYRGRRAERDIAVWSSAGVPLGPRRLPIARPGVKSIVFCGSLRFFREFKALSAALALLERKYGRRIVLRLFSNKQLDLPGVEYMGFETDRVKLVETLRESDLAYSPLSLDAKDRLLVETSFPGKIATYLQADLPILAHAPASATNYRFVLENDVGIGIDTLDPERIAEQILNYDAASELRQRHAGNCYDVLRKKFDPASRREFFSALFEDSPVYADTKAGQ